MPLPPNNPCIGNLKSKILRSAEDFSFGMLITFSLGVFLWLVYGVGKNELPIILPNLVTLSLNCIIILLKLKYR